ncbi:dimethyladenosine transferase [Peptostreptococcaceae bacterium oral taxon 113 str. W5053]|nr:dimethyladenosine transferase [Peptostreptococcaceae bacterium oral taxon 113 str. W5053]
MNRPLYSPKTIQDLLERHGFTFSKALGQNFLIDGNIIEKIIGAADIQNKNILEIGPGFGVLSHRLSEKGKKLLLVEMDRRLEPVLKEVLADRDNVEIIFSDVLKLDLHRVLKERFGGEKVNVVANLPYYVTTPILAHLLEDNLPIESITVMVQKEVAKRMAAKANTKDYGSLSLLVQYYTQGTVICTVPNTVFMPRPKVESAVVYLKLRGVSKNENFFKVTRAAFNMRRKTLVNALAKGLNLEKAKIADCLSAINLSEQIRGEELSLEQYLELSQLLFMESILKRYE